MADRLLGLNTVFTWSHITVLLGVVAIDLSLAVDNSIVMGVAAAKLPPSIRRRTILIGVSAAALFRIIFATFALRLLSVIGLTLAGGFLLFWVGWKLWRELYNSSAKAQESVNAHNEAIIPAIDQKLFKRAIWQIFFADVSMSLDNVLAVAGTARNHFWIMVFGLALSVAFMTFAANLLAELIHRHRWISYIGLAIVFYVALSMIWDGAHEVLNLREVSLRF